LIEETLEAAARIASNAPLSVAQARRAIHAGLQTDLAAGLQLEIEAYIRLVDTDDRREGIRAFNEKRKPKFQGR
jgi:enoyl-CoA hydratase